MIGRRWIVRLALLPIASSGVAQPISGRPRVALVEPGEPVENIAIGRHPYWDALLRELSALGHDEGDSVILERWTAAGTDNAGYARLAEAVVASRPDVIIARGSPAIRELAAATDQVPIVGLGTFPASVNLARPGDNLTGIDVGVGVDLYKKQLQLLRDAVAGASRIRWLGPEDYWNGPVGEAVRQAAQEMQLTLVPAFVVAPTSEPTIRAALSASAEADAALFVSSSPDMTAYRAIIAELALASDLASISFQRDYAEAGLMMAYGPDFTDVYRRAAGYVDRILGGVDPGDMAIERPSLFEFVVNLRTTQALGLSLPPEIMAFATEFIE